MQLSSKGPPLPVHDDTLARDAEALSQALEDLARVYQLQDPRQTCSYGINLTECYALEAVVQAGPLTVNEIASRLSMDKASASRAVASLARKRYVRRRVHPDDSRALQVDATPSGERLYERIHAAGRACHRRLLESVAPDVRTSLTLLLRRLVEAEAECASTTC
jgi:MarR family 2-MHQ and catechol resistance regulon transcriptional repressor